MLRTIPGADARYTRSPPAAQAAPLGALPPRTLRPPFVSVFGVSDSLESISRPEVQKPQGLLKGSRGPGAAPQENSDAPPGLPGEPRAPPAVGRPDEGRALTSALTCRASPHSARARRSLRNGCGGSAHSQASSARPASARAPRQPRTSLPSVRGRRTYSGAGAGRGGACLKGLGAPAPFIVLSATTGPSGRPAPGSRRRPRRGVRERLLGRSGGASAARPPAGPGLGSAPAPRPAGARSARQGPACPAGCAHGQQLSPRSVLRPWMRRH